MVEKQIYQVQCALSTGTLCQDLSLRRKIAGIEQFCLIFWGMEVEEWKTLRSRKSEGKKKEVKIKHKTHDSNSRGLICVLDQIETYYNAIKNLQKKASEKVKYDPDEVSRKLDEAQNLVQKRVMIALREKHETNSKIKPYIDKRDNIFEVEEKSVDKAIVEVEDMIKELVDINKETSRLDGRITSIIYGHLGRNEARICNMDLPFKFSSSLQILEGSSERNEAFSAAYGDVFSFDVKGIKTKLKFPWKRRIDVLKKINLAINGERGVRNAYELLSDFERNSYRRESYMDYLQLIKQNWEARKESSRIYADATATVAELEKDLSERWYLFRMTLKAKEQLFKIEKSTLDEQISQKRVSLDKLLNRMNDIRSNIQVFKRFKSKQSDYCKDYEAQQSKFEKHKKATEALKEEMKELSKRRRRHSEGSSIAYQAKYKDYKVSKEYLGNIIKSAPYRRAIANIRTLSRHRPEHLFYYEDLSPLYGTAAQDIQIRSLLEYDFDRKADKGNVFPACVEMEMERSINTEQPPRTDIETIVWQILAREQDLRKAIKECKKECKKHSEENVQPIIQRVRAKMALEAADEKGKKFSEPPLTAKKSFKYKCMLKYFGQGKSGNFTALKRSAHVMKKLAHPNIMPLQGICCDDASNYYLQLPRYQCDLRQWMVTNRPKQFGHGEREKRAREIWSARCMKIIRGILEGLHYLHSVGVIHRDLKPDNILVGPPYSSEAVPLLTEHSEFAVIGDFDCSKIGEKVDGRSVTTQIVYSAGYTDPDVAKSGQNKASDIWSLGVIVGEVLTGRMLKSVVDVDHNDDLLPTEKAFLRKLLHHEQARRPSAFEILAEPILDGYTPKRKCAYLCQEEKDIDQCVSCSNELVRHYICKDCLKEFVVDEISNENWARFKMRRGNLTCPVTDVKGTLCKSKCYSDHILSTHLPRQVFEEYIKKKVELHSTEKEAEIIERETKKWKEYNEKLNKMSARKRRIKIACQQIQEEILNNRCPNCTCVFTDFSHCFSVTCKRCSVHFCAWCLDFHSNCKIESHAHVRECKDSLNRGDYYARESMVDGKKSFEIASRRRRTRKLQQFLSSKRIDEATEIVKEMQKDLLDLGLNRIVKKYLGSSFAEDRDQILDDQHAAAVFMEQLGEIDD